LPPADFRFRIAAAAILLLTALLCLVRLDARSIWAMENRWVVTAREMSITGNYFWPTLNGRPHFHKPLGSYWLMIATGRVTGEVNEFAARFPSAVWGIVGVLLIMLLARRLYDERTALWAGLILATSYSYVFYSRTAAAESATVTGILAAVMIFAIKERNPAGWWLIGLWTVMALTSLTKGLAGFAVPIAIFVAYSCFADGWAALRDALSTGPLGGRLRWLIERNRWLFNRRSIPAIAIGAAIYLAPYVASAIAYGSAEGLHMVIRENIERFFRPFDHRGPVYLYVYVILALAAPWSLLLPAALVEAHHARRAGAEPARADRLVLAYFWATFLFFTLSGSRRSYYIVPILPAVALVVATTITRREAFQSLLGARLFKYGFAVLAIATLGGVLALLPPSAVLWGRFATLPPAPARGLYLVLWLIAAAAIVYAWRNFDRSRAAAAFATVAAVALGYVFLIAMPATEAYRGERPFVLEARERVGDQIDDLALFRTLVPVYYLGQPKPVKYYYGRNRLHRAVRDGKVKWLIFKRRELRKLGVPVEVVLEEPSFPWEHKSVLREKELLARVTGMPAVDEVEERPPPPADAPYLDLPDNDE
jgi:4-amino-4-deoxy-L-arabinose transferase-like glycosyltransferase